ncbi:MAG: metallophosphoesterase [Planctomycetota bacterium]|nr:metallophosphoesterase [Planctomycetota bacterium]
MHPLSPAASPVLHSLASVLLIAVSLLAMATAARAESAATTSPSTQPASAKLFRLWTFGDAHVGTDLAAGRESLADAIRQSEGSAASAGGPAIPWDIALDVGDNSGGQSVPKDDEGKEIVRQFSALKNHRREQVYDLCGNHDRSGLKEPEAWWFRKWIDPEGKSTAHSGVDATKRPYPIEGTWERYSFRVGNLLFLVMSDINEPTQKIGRGELGGNPAGVVSQATFDWWRKMVNDNPESIIICAHHYLLKNTTTATGDWEGMIKDSLGNWKSGYHGYKEKGTPIGASYLYWVGSKPDSGAFENFLAAKKPADAPGGSNAVAIWLGGHTHPLSPDDKAGGKELIATKWGVNFINVCSLTQHHENKGSGFTTTPMSRLLTFTPGSDKVRVQCYMHTKAYAPIGWYDKAERVLTLPRAFEAPRP